MAEGVAPVATIARVLRVSRQSLYYAPKQPDHVGARPRLRLVPPPLPDDWQTCALSPAVIDLHGALHVLARRHPAAGYRKLCSRLRRAGWLVNRKRIARLLRAWGFQRRKVTRHPKAQGRPFDITAPNELWQTEVPPGWRTSSVRRHWSSRQGCCDAQTTSAGVSSTCRRARSAA